MKIAEIPEIKDLSIPEKILLVEDLWDNIALESGQVPILDSHKEELDKRLSEHEKNPSNLLTLKQLQERIDKRK